MSIPQEWEPYRNGPPARAATQHDNSTFPALTHPGEERVAHIHRTKHIYLELFQEPFTTVMFNPINTWFTPLQSKCGSPNLFHRS